MFRNLTIVGVCAALTMLTSCGMENGSGPVLDATANWAVAFETSFDPGSVIDDDNPQTTEQALGGAPDSVTIETATLVIRSLHFENGSVDAPDTNITAEDQNRDAGDETIRFKGPFVCDMGAANNLGTQNVASGQFDRVVFVLDPAANLSQAGGRPELVGRSILVSGQVWRDERSSRFEFGSDFSSEIVVGGSFELASGQSCEGVVTVVAGRWFRASDGTCLDPENVSERATVLRNIRSNISGVLSVQ